MFEQASHSLKMRDVRITDGFWGKMVQTVCEKMLPYQWDVLNDQAEDAPPSGCIRNFKIAAGLQTGDFSGMVFQDSDLAKWIEAAAYSLSVHPDEEMERRIDEAIEYVAKAQQQDGYLDTYFTIKAPEMRWTDLRDCHELYCAGHMMEAAVAYYEVTGKRTLLDVMLRTARHIMQVIGPEEGKIHGYPGHPEIELALMRMYQATGEVDLLRLARYFVDERGKSPNFFVEEEARRGTEGHFPQNITLGLSYFQSHLPVREQKTMEGHSVRALYLLCGMIDVAVHDMDEELLQACYALFDNATQKRMYVTGGVGSTSIGEAFTADYDLPNDMAYAETCASVALVFVAQRLLHVHADGRIADIMETALYNTCLAGMAQDARHFFYVNPLEVVPKVCEHNPDHRHVLPERPAWYGCACCPPNLARLICSLGSYAYSMDETTLYLHLYISGSAQFEMQGKKCSVSVETWYPYDGRIRICPRGGKYRLGLHLPGWCKSYCLKINGEEAEAICRSGYLLVERAWQEDDTVELILDLAPRRIYANPIVVHDTDCVAIASGPLVYCAEEADHGKALHLIHLPRQSSLVRTEKEMPGLGRFVGIEAEALTAAPPVPNAPLYGDCPVTYDHSVRLQLIPYYLWANRGKGEMRVWLHEGEK